MSVVTININGMDYNLRGRESEEYLLEVARYVDEKVKDIMTKNRKLSSTAGATLVAINIADELYKADIEMENLIKKNTSLEEINVTLKERINEVREEYESNNELSRMAELLKSENLTLREELENYFNEVEILKKANEILEKKEKEHSEKFNKLNEEYRLLEESYKKYKDENEALKVRNKETKFQLQNYRYKVLDLEKKLIDSQVNLVTEKRKGNALLK